MRKPKTRFSLKFAGGVDIPTMDALRENFDLKGCIEYLRDDKLATWLEDRLYDDEAAAVRALDAKDTNLPQNICKIFGMDFDSVSEQLDDPETIEWRKARRERLKKFTSDPAIIKHVDDVAFDQDDLIDILQEESIPGTIYLCDGKFIFPSGALKKNSITYVGVSNNVTVKIDTPNPVDLYALGISFKNVKIDDSRKIPSESTPTNKISTHCETSVIYKKSWISISDANKIADFANLFYSSITLNVGATTVNAKSSAFISQMKLATNSRILIVADGDDAKTAAEKLANFIANNFTANDLGTTEPKEIIKTVAKNKIYTFNRNAEKIVREASHYNAKIWIEFDNKTIELIPSNISALNAVGINKYSGVKVIAIGDDSKRAVHDLDFYISNRLKA